MTDASLLVDRETIRSDYRTRFPSGVRTRYVAGTGSDSAAGTVGAPYRTIQHAIDSAVAGDRILVDNGTYGYSQLYDKHGTAQAWISIESLPGANPVIDVSNAVHASADGMDVQLSTYVGIFGLEIRALQTQTSNTDASGIGIFRASHHIATWANDVHDFPGGGINHFFIGPDVGNGLPGGGWDLVDCSYNTIHACSKYSQYNTSGISFYGAVDYTHSTWEGRYGYRAVGNYIFDCMCLVPYTPGGFLEPTDGNGISVDSLAVANSLYPDLIAYIKRGLVEGNVIAACGGRGVHTYNSVNLDCFHNTAIGNLRSTSSYIVNSVEFDLQLDEVFPDPQVVYQGNVIIPLNTSNTTDADATNLLNVICGGTQSVTGTNIDRRGTGSGYLNGAPNLTALIAGVPLASFIPLTPNAITKPTPAVQGRQVLAIGYRAGRGTWVAGAVEPVVIAKVVV